MILCIYIKITKVKRIIVNNEFLGSWWYLYKDTKFKELAEGQKLEKYGPFKEYSEARQKWDYHSWQNVDNCFLSIYDNSKVINTVK